MSEKEEKKISLYAYSKLRKKQGRSPHNLNVLYKYSRNGKITVDENNMVYVSQADQELIDNIDVSYRRGGDAPPLDGDSGAQSSDSGTNKHAAKKANNSKNSRKNTKNDDKPPETGKKEKKETSLMDYSRKKALYDSRMKELAFKERSGELVLASEISKRAFELAKITKTNLLNIPNKISNELAAEVDPHKIKIMLINEINEALESMIKEVK